MKEALIQARDSRVQKNIERDKVRAKERRREQETRQVARFIDATKSFVVALKLAENDASEGLFSPEAGRFVSRKLDEIRDLMSGLEKAIKKSKPEEK